MGTAPLHCGEVTDLEQEHCDPCQTQCCHLRNGLATRPCKPGGNRGKEITSVSCVQLPGEFPPGTPRPPSSAWLCSFLLAPTPLPLLPHSLESPPSLQPWVVLVCWFRSTREPTARPLSFWISGRGHSLHRKTDVSSALPDPGGLLSLAPPRSAGSETHPFASLWIGCKCCAGGGGWRGNCALGTGKLSTQTRFWHIAHFNTGSSNERRTRRAQLRGMGKWTLSFRLPAGPQEHFLAAVRPVAADAGGEEKTFLISNPEG